MVSIKRDGYSIEEYATGYRFRIPTGCLDNIGQKRRQDILSRYRKSASWIPRISFLKREYETPEDAERSFIDQIDGTGAPISLSDGERRIVGFVKRNERGQMTIELTEDEPEPQVSKVYADPFSDEAKSFIGKTVEVSMTYGFENPTIVKLESTDSDGFHGVLLTGGEESLFNVRGTFMREHIEKRRPLDLSDSSVRDSLRGRWLRERNSGAELMVRSFGIKEGVWLVNGSITAEALMEGWEYLEGGLIGVEE